MPKKIETLKDLRRLARRNSGVDVFILLNGGLKSSKHLNYYRGRWRVENFIDDSVTTLQNSNVEEALNKGALFLDE